VRSQDEFGHPSHGYKNLTGYQGKDVADAGGTPGSHLNLQSLIGTEICITVPLMRKSLIDVVAEVTSGNQTDPMVSGCRYICGMVNKVEMLPIRNRSALYRLEYCAFFVVINQTGEQPYLPTQKPA
jgi:type VI secretion system secreted protein VgrG